MVPPHLIQKLKEGEVPHCHFHRDRSAVSICVLCYKPLCIECRSIVDGVNLCARCLLREYHGKSQVFEGCSSKKSDSFAFLLSGVFVSALILEVVVLSIAFIVTSHSSGDLEEKNRRRLETVRFGIQDFWRDMGRYPTNEEGLMALLSPLEEDEGRKANWNGPYLSRNILTSSGREVKDIYNQAILYRNWGDGSFVYIASSGANRRWDTPLLTHPSFSGDIRPDDMVIFIENPFH